MKSKLFVLSVLIALAVLGGLSGAACAQSFNVSSTYIGTHPVVAQQQACGMAIENRYRDYQVHQQMREEYESRVYKKFRKDLDAHQRGVVQHAEEWSRLKAKFGARIHPVTGEVYWPEILQDMYPQQTARIGRLFQERLTGRSGIGSRNYREIENQCQSLLARLDHDLRETRHFTAAEYADFRNTLMVMRDIAKTTPSFATAYTSGNDWGHDKATHAKRPTKESTYDSQ